MNSYRIRATYLDHGRVVACNTEEVLGNEIRYYHASHASAAAVARDLQVEIGEYCLDPTTRYYVEEIADTAECLRLDPTSLDVGEV